MKWELMVLELLNWDLSAITPYCILDQLLRRLLQPLNDLRGQFDDLQSIRNYSETLLSLAITETGFLTVSPSLVAISSLITAMSSLKQRPASMAEAEPLVANFLHTLFELTGLNIEEVTTVIHKLEAVVRVRIALETANKQAAAVPIMVTPYCNKVVPSSSNTNPSGINNTGTTASRTPTEMVKASTTCVC